MVWFLILLAAVVCGLVMKHVLSNVAVPSAIPSVQREEVRSPALRPIHSIR